LIGALAHRVAREEDTLYPTMEAADALAVVPKRDGRPTS